MIRNNDTSYGLISKIMHWLIAAIIIFMIALGWYMTELDYYDPFYHDAITLHKSLGMLIFMLIFMLMCLKLIWLFISPMPKPEHNPNKFEAIAANIVHKLLWGLIILLPITGYIVSTSAGAPISFFGLFYVPSTIEVLDTTRDKIIIAHYYLAYIGAAIIALHIAAALKHHFIDKNNTLMRMIK